VIPVVTRYVRIDQPMGGTDDAYDDVTWLTVEASTPAHIGPPSADALGDQYQQIDAVLYVNDTATVPTDARVTDLGTGDVYSVRWAQHVVGLGLDHRKCGLRRSSGAA
jgi:hypothetical protein